MTATDLPLDAIDIPRVQRRTVGVLAGSQVLSGIAIAGSVAAGSLIAVSVSGSEAVAGLAQTFGVLGAALMALPLARLALSRVGAPRCRWATALAEREP